MGERAVQSGCEKPANELQRRMMYDTGRLLLRSSSSTDSVMLTPASPGGMLHGFDNLLDLWLHKPRITSCDLSIFANS
jgi:hypothetical protein